MPKLQRTAAPLSVILGAAGFALRRVWRSQGFEKVMTGFGDIEEYLPIRGHYTITLQFALLALFCVLAIAVTIWVRKKKLSAGYNYGSAFTTIPASTFAQYSYFLLVLACGFCMALLSFPYLKMAQDTINSKITTVCITALFALAGIALAALPIASRFSAPKKPSMGILCLTFAPEILFALLLTLYFRDHQTDPLLIGITPNILALASCAGGFYTETGYAFNKPTPCRAILSHMCAVFFGITALGDMEITPIFWLILIASLILFVNLVTFSFRLKRNTDEERFLPKKRKIRESAV